MARTLWGLIAGLVLALSASLVPDVAKASSNASYDAAMAACAAYDLQAAFPSVPVSGASCIVDPCRGTKQVFKIGTVNGVTRDGCNAAPGLSWNAWSFTGNAPTPSDICKDRPNLHQAFDGVYTSVTNAGCKYTRTDDAAAIEVCRTDSAGILRCTGMSTWKPNGEAVGNPPPAADPPPLAPALCGPGVCFDGNANKYCANAGAVCVDAPSPTSPPAGGCITGGDTTLCIGTPIPPKPSNPPVSDPASQIAASDKFTQKTGGPTNPITNVTVNNYNATGSNPQNGAKPGDSQDPAPSSSSGGAKGDGTRASGGGNCNTPPICEGAAATCMVVTQTYLLRCPPGGTGAGSNDGDTSVPGLDGISDKPGAGFMREETLLDKLDKGGFGGGGQCPKLLSIDIDRYSVHGDSDSLPWCSILDKAGYLLLFLAAWISYRILSEK